MVNPEKLLGGLLCSGMRGGAKSSLVTGGAALGLVGVAMEAVEHFMNRPQGAERVQGTGARPPLPGSAPPPPPPGRPTMTPPPPPVDKPAGKTTGGNHAVLLIRAMITAANADGVIDARERASILDKLDSIDLSEEEHAFIVRELLAPRSMQDIVAEVESDDMARQVYAVSLMAIEVDTGEEKDYLNRLAANLGLDSETISDIHRQFGIFEV